MRPDEHRKAGSGFAVAVQRLTPGLNRRPGTCPDSSAAATRRPTEAEIQLLPPTQTGSDHRAISGSAAQETAEKDAVSIEGENSLTCGFAEPLAMKLD
jgi:hypothetical protein